VSEQILNGTSAQLGYTVPVTSVYAGFRLHSARKRSSLFYNAPEPMHTEQGNTI